MKKIYFLTALFLSNVIVGQSVVRSKNDLNSNKNTSNSRSSSSSNVSFVNGDNIGFFIEMGYYLTYGLLIGDYTDENHLNNNLNSHPFSNKGKGNYTETDTLNHSNFRLDLENHFVTSGNDLKGNHLDVKIRPSKYFYLKTDYYQLFEHNTFTNQNDGLSLFFFNFAYDRIRTESFNFGWTMGGSYVGNEVQKGGFSYGFNAEYFMDNNISLSVDSKWSSINYNPVNSLELKAKYFKGNYFGSIGYERLKIGSPVYNLIGIGAGIYF